MPLINNTVEYRGRFGKGEIEKKKQSEGWSSGWWRVDVELGSKWGKWRHILRLSEGEKPERIFFFFSFALHQILHNTIRTVYKLEEAYLVTEISTVLLLFNARTELHKVVANVSSKSFSQWQRCIRTSKPLPADSLGYFSLYFKGNCSFKGEMTKRALKMYKAMGDPKNSRRAILICKMIG